jgi:hypothetical protein
MLPPETPDDFDTASTPDTRDIAAEISAVRRRRNRGIELKPCHHVFCGVSVSKDLRATPQINNMHSPASLGLFIAISTSPSTLRLMAQYWHHLRKVPLGERQSFLWVVQ